MHPLHDYVVKQLADKLKDRRVVVWYDERGDFRPFVDELRGGPRGASGLMALDLAGVKASLAEYAGSLFELRTVLEPLVSGDAPEAVVVYIPGLAHDAKTSVLMELEKAGHTWKPELKQLAKSVLLQKFKLGVIDEMLPFDRAVSYEDVARAAAGGSQGEPPSILQSVFHDASDADGLITLWLASDARDASIVSKDAVGELSKLLKARLGLSVAANGSLAKLRATSFRFVLASEFRLDLSQAAPASLDDIPKPSAKEEQSVREIARRLRASHADSYAISAQRVEEELGLPDAQLDGAALGSIDTFPFEERALLKHASACIAVGNFETAITVIAERERSFWLDRDVRRKAQWAAASQMAELGKVASTVASAVKKMSGDAAAWLDAYSTQSESGWFRLDQAQRRLEALIAKLEEDVDEKALALVRRGYEDAVHAMADGFTRALSKSGWSVPGALHQTRIWSDVVADKPKPVAYFLVDAMRFEMGVALAERLVASEVSVRAAIASLPSITPIGMAALMPGASSSFTVVSEKEKLGARIDQAFLPDLAARKKHAAARIPQLVDLTLDDLSNLSSAKLTKKIEGAHVVMVRSQEIDQIGEAGSPSHARHVMDSVLNNIARAIRKLAAAGIEHAVVSADHGHLFFAADRDESMRTDAPGGMTVDLHRRCWIGRGGATSAGCVRVSAASLGYASDLEFVFPEATGVFKAGGDLAFHHGGPTLQELVIPVLTVRTKNDSASPKAAPIEASGLPTTVTNRIFSVTFTYGAKQMAFAATSIQVRPLLMAGGKQVGSVGMAVGADFDRTTGQVKFEPNKPVTIAFLLADEAAASLRVVVQDPATDTVLYRSPTDIPIRLGV